MPSKRTLAEVDLNSERPGPIKKGRSAENGSSKLSSKPKNASTLLEMRVGDASPPNLEDKALSNIWVRLCPAAKDESSDDEDSEKSSEAKEQACGHAGGCIDRAPRIADPAHQWIISKKGIELAQEWTQQQEKRCQDNYNMYIFNDWNGYGISEVIENIFLGFAKFAKKTQTSRKRPDWETILAMWAHVESAALFLNGDIGEMHGIERQDNAKRVMLVGSMILYVLDLLWKVDISRDEGDKLLRNHSELPNLGVILALFLQFAEDSREMCKLNEDGWKYLVVKKADEFGINIKGVKGTRAIVEAIRNGNERADEPPEVPDDLQGRVKAVLGELSHWMACYKREDFSGLITLESLNQGTRRSWSSYDFYMEIDAYKSQQAVKVGTMGPEYRGNIGGKFYDLTAQRNKGSHMRDFRL